MAPKPGFCAIGPVWPKPDRRTITRPGLSTRSVSQPSPSFSMTPGRKFSITMSACAQSFRAIAAASGSLRLSVSDFLLRAWTYHQSEVPSCILRHWRKGSPPSGDSILMTSAPNSASTRAQNGPAISVPNSTTRTPDSGFDASPGLFPAVLSGIPASPWKARIIRPRIAPALRRYGLNRFHLFDSNEQSRSRRAEFPGRAELLNESQMKISLDALAMLDAIDARGSFAAAADALHRVPSALTHAVRKLEDDLGFPLFEK